MRALSERGRKPGKRHGGPPGSSVRHCLLQLVQLLTRSLPFGAPVCARPRFALHARCAGHEDTSILALWRQTDLEAAQGIQSLCQICYHRLLPRHVPDKIHAKLMLMLESVSQKLRKPTGCRLSPSGTVRDSMVRVVELKGMSVTMAKRLLSPLGPPPEGDQPPVVPAHRALHRAPPHR